jgi:hypothetical protein
MLEAQGSRIKDNKGAPGFSLVPFAVRPAPDTYASFLGISEALYLDLFEQPVRKTFAFLLPPGNME